MKIAFALVASAFLLTACETPITPRYAISAENNQAIKAAGASGVALKYFTGPSDFDPNCRAIGALQIADGLNHANYIQRAFEDELKVAGAFSATEPRVVLGGKITRLEFASAREHNKGYWQIDLTLDSSNGKVLYISEYYNFTTSLHPGDACRHTADAYLRAAQNLVGKAVKSPGFAEMLK